MYSFQASFKLSMIREAGYKSLFNMPIEESKPYGLPSQGLTRDNFVTSVNMSTYLVAFVVCDFDFKQNTTAKGTLVNICNTIPTVMRSILLCIFCITCYLCSAFI